MILEFESPSIFGLSQLFICRPNTQIFPCSRFEFSWECCGPAFSNFSVCALNLSLVGITNWILKFKLKKISGFTKFPDRVKILCNYQKNWDTERRKETVITLSTNCLMILEFESPSIFELSQLSICRPNTLNFPCSRVEFSCACCGQSFSNFSVCALNFTLHW